MEDRKIYIDKLTTQLKEWDDEVNELETRVERAKADAKERLKEKIDELRTKKDAAQNRLQEIRDASDDAWESLKEGLEKSWSDLRQSLGDAISRFDKIPR